MSRILKHKMLQNLLFYGSIKGKVWARRGVINSSQPWTILINPQDAWWVITRAMVEVLFQTLIHFVMLLWAFCWRISSNCDTCVPFVWILLLFCYRIWYFSCNKHAWLTGAYEFWLMIWKQVSFMICVYFNNVTF